MDIEEQKSLKKVKFAIEQSIKAHSTGVAVLFGWGWVRNTSPGSFYPREGKNVPILKRGVWAPGPVRTSSEYFASTGIQSPDRPARLAARTELSRM